MPKKKVEVYDKDQLIYPFIENDHVTFSNGMKVSEMLDQSISMPTVTHEDLSFKVGVGDQDVSSAIVDSSVSKMTIKGKTYQNILPEPSTHVLTNNKEMFKVNEGLDSNVEVVDGVSKSAILKGQTLVNILDGKKLTTSNPRGSYTYDGKFITNTSGTDHSSWPTMSSISNLTKPNSDYCIMLYNPSSVNITLQLKFINTNESDTYSSKILSGEKKSYKITSTSDTNGLYLKFFPDDLTTLNTKLQIMIIEYQDGMENWDIPYFEGMQSVKMPVLTTTGKNLIDNEVLNYDFSGAASTGYTISVPTAESRIIIIDVKPSTTYTLSWGDLTGYSTGHIRVGEFKEKTIGSVSISQFATNIGNSFKTFTTTSQTNFIAIKVKDGVEILDNEQSLMLVEGSEKIPYEPYKSNILHTPEEVVLRSLPNGAKDTLNLNTGEYVQRICEVVLDGSESWNQEGQRYWTPLGGHIVGNTGKTDDNVLSNKYVFVPHGVLSGTDIAIGQCRWGADQNFMVNQDNGAMGVASWKTYLSQNPLTIQCQLVTPVIKTVDLSSSGNWEKIVLDGSENWLMTNNTHFYTMLSNELSPNALLPIIDNSLFTPKDNSNSTANAVWYGGNVGAKNGNIIFNVLDKTLEQFKQYLSQNPITVWYPTQSHKDSTQVKQPIFFKDGYIQLSSGVENSLIPTLDYQAKTSNSYVMDLMKTNTKYTMKAKSANGTFTIDGTSYGAGTNGTFTTPTSMTNKLLVMSNKANTEVMILEGDVVSKNIPYFKGIKSAFEDESKIEVLSTGRNLCPPQPEIEGHYVRYQNGAYTQNDSYNVSKPIRVIEGHRYRLINTNFNHAYYDKNMNYVTTKIGNGVDADFYSIAPKNAVYLRVSMMKGLEVVVNTDGTKGEYRESNSTKIPLLSPLRKLPNGVYDEVILDRENHKAKIIQRVGKAVLNGSEVISLDYPHVYNDTIAFKVGNTSLPNKDNGGIISDTLKGVDGDGYWLKDEENIMTANLNNFKGRILRSKLTLQNAEGVKRHLQQNPLTVYYELATPVITEVDLEGFPYVYKDGHIFLNSEIAPTMEITYSINQGQQISASNEDIIRHEKELTYLQKLIAQYIQVDYESALLSLKV